MIKKDYIKIAAVLVNAYAESTIKKIELGKSTSYDSTDNLIANIQNSLMEIFENDNSLFNETTFRNYISKGLLDRYRLEFAKDIKEYPDETKPEQRLIKIYEETVSEM